MSQSFHSNTEATHGGTCAPRPNWPPPPSVGTHPTLAPTPTGVSRQSLLTAADTTTCRWSLLAAAAVVCRQYLLTSNSLRRY